MAESYGLFFSGNGQTVRLPVNPETFPIERTTDNGDYNVLGIGQIVIPRTPQLKTITLSSFFPGRPFSGVLTSGGFQPPEFYIAFFENAMKNKTVLVFSPLRFYEDGTPFFTSDTSMQCVVTDFQTEERGGETGDFYYTLSITEWRDYAPKEWLVQKAPDKASPIVVVEEPAREIPQDQIVVGSTCIANGRYYASSYGDEPHGNANGRTVKVSRIVDKSRAYPYHITTESGGALGWINADGLQIVTGAGTTVPNNESTTAKKQQQKNNNSSTIVSETKQKKQFTGLKKQFTGLKKHNGSHSESGRSF